MSRKAEKTFINIVATVLVIVIVYFVGTFFWELFHAITRMK